ncbi:hypothetical protein GCM10027605_51850 [Micromonospora zhanjiangensis]
MRLGSEVHNQIRFGDKLIDHGGIANVPMDELGPIGDRPQRGLISCVGQRVEDADLVLGMVSDCVMNKVRTDETGPAGHKHPRHIHASYGSPLAQERALVIGPRRVGTAPAQQPGRARSTRIGKWSLARLVSSVSGTS